MYEDLIAFTPNVPNAPFQILMSGISYCDGTYKISRPNSPLYCFEYIYKGKGMVHLNQAAFPAKAGPSRLPTLLTKVSASSRMRIERYRIV